MSSKRSKSVAGEELPVRPTDEKLTAAIRRVADLRKESGATGKVTSTYVIEALRQKGKHAEADELERLVAVVKLRRQKVEARRVASPRKTIKTAKNRIPPPSQEEKNPLSVENTDAVFDRILELREFALGKFGTGTHADAIAILRKRNRHAEAEEFELLLKRRTG